MAESWRLNDDWLKRIDSDTQEALQQEESTEDAADASPAFVKVDQADIEKEVIGNIEKVAFEKENEQDQKKLEKTRQSVRKARDALERVQIRLQSTLYPSGKKKLKEDIVELEKALEAHKSDERFYSERIARRARARQDIPESPMGQRPGETRQDYLIRIGKITPFTKVSDGAELPTLEEMLSGGALDLGEENEDRVTESHQNLHVPGFLQTSQAKFQSQRSRKRVRSLERQSESSKRPKTNDLEADLRFKDSDEDPSVGTSHGSGSEYTATRASSATPQSETPPAAQDSADGQIFDDGNEEMYRSRLKLWSERRSAARLKESTQQESNEEIPEWQRPHPTLPDFQKGEFRVPGDIYPALYSYQQTGVQWLWEIYQQGNGGIIGDEMGLGKTIQAIGLIAGLHYSDMLSKPIIVVAPATVLKQWVKEFHQWWPPLRVSILHSSGSGMLKTKSIGDDDEEFNDDYLDEPMTISRERAQKIVQRVVKKGHVLVTTYNGLKSYADLIRPVDWGYAILDEGHKIRNPDADVTIYCKELRTHNRLILSGTPMQNNLTELWSLFDFVYPMRLDTLVDFKRNFEIPIKLGSYTNASALQMQTASECAKRLREAIRPYLLQRFKSDVAADLPAKTESVLLCKLSKEQRNIYQSMVYSAEMKDIQEKTPLKGIDILRKICNHPDLINREYKKKQLGADYGNRARSGKMAVVEGMLKQFKAIGRKTLLFCQTKQMLDILESMVTSMKDPPITHVRMDGEYAIGARQQLVDRFNTSPEIDLFLLTTKVGGLGINLTSASRVIIYDPDWNPSTDSQAKERAWRLGQKRDVAIFRLLTAGTVEDKIYKRQIYKEFLNQKVMKDPTASRQFSVDTLADLFSLEPEAQPGSTSSSAVASDFQAALSRFTAETAAPQIDGVVASEQYAPADRDTAPKDQDAEMLSAIFSKAGVHSALNHDSVLGNPSYKSQIAMRDAKLVADEASASLEKAKLVAEATPAGVPTWTGNSGIAGRDRPHAGRGGGVPSAAALLLQSSNRQAVREGGRQTADKLPDGFRERLMEYFERYDGVVVVRMLVQTFSREVVTEGQKKEFMGILKDIAREIPGGSAGRQKWVLRKDVVASAGVSPGSSARGSARSSPARSGTGGNAARGRNVFAGAATPRIAVSSGAGMLGRGQNVFGRR